MGEVLDTLVLGVDLGTHETGAVLVDVEYNILRHATWTAEGEPKSLDKRLEGLYGWLELTVWQMVAEARTRFFDKRQYQIIIAIEMPHIRYARATKALFQALGILRSIVWRESEGILELSRQIIEITPADAKLALTGRGNASKQLVLDISRALSGCLRLNQHQADAYAVACAAWGKLHQEAMLERAKGEGDASN